MVTGDSQEGVLIFRYTQTLHHNIYILTNLPLPDHPAPLESDPTGQTSDLLNQRRLLSSRAEHHLMMREVFGVNTYHCIHLNNVRGIGEKRHLEVEGQPS